MARAFDAIFVWVPNRRAAKMGANRDESVNPVFTANHPDALLFFHSRADFPGLIILRLARHELLWRFVENPGKEKPNRTDRDTATK